MTKKFLANFLLLIFTLIFIEIFFAIFFISRPNPTISIIFKPFTNYDKIEFANRIEYFDYTTNKYKPGFYKSGDINYQINEYGFRGPDFNLDKLRLDCFGIAYGGSTTIGLETIFEHTYPELVSNKLKNFGKECKILNAGVSSKSLKYIFNRLIEEVEIYNPKFITIYSNRNSAMYDSTLGEIKSDIITSQLSLNLYKINFYLENNVMTYKFLKKISQRFTEIKSGTPHPYDSKRSLNINYFENEYLSILEQISEFLITRNIQPILIKQIYYIDVELQKKLLSNKIEKNLDLLKKYNRINLYTNNEKNLNDTEKINNFFMLTNTILNQNLDVLKKNYSQVKVVDSIDEFFKFKSTETTFDGYHLNKKGNEILSDKIYKSLENII